MPEASKVKADAGWDVTAVAAVAAVARGRSNQLLLSSAFVEAHSEVRSVAAANPNPAATATATCYRTLPDPEIRT